MIGSLSFAATNFAISWIAPNLGSTASGLSSSQTGLVRMAVQTMLKDPESARFGRIKSAPLGEDKRTVCGFLNAKNSLGGYVGDQAFSRLLGPNKDNETIFTNIEIGNDIDTNKSILGFCDVMNVQLCDKSSKEPLCGLWEHIDLGS